MSGNILNDVIQALRLAVFERDELGQLRLAGATPGWLPALWPTVGEGGILTPEVSPFLENFLVDAALGWKEDHRVNSGPWVETDSSGQAHHLQASGLRVSGRAVLLVEDLGAAYEERTTILQKAHERALAYEQLLRTGQLLSEGKRRLEEQAAGLSESNTQLAAAQVELEQRVNERTAELSHTNAALREEVATRRRYAERLRNMDEIDRAILAAKSPEAIAEAALRRLHPWLPCEHASVVELDPQSGRATILASIDQGSLQGTRRWELSKQQLATAQVLTSGQLHRVENVANLFQVPSEVVDSWPLVVDAPLIVEETLVGILNLATRSPEAWTHEHEEIALEVATQLAVAIQQARLFAQISAGREQLRALSLRLVEVQEAERRFLAHELHDEIGQVLTGLKLTLELPGGSATKTADPRLTEAIAMVDELMNRVRQLSLDLRPQVLDDLGLVPALDWLFKRYLKQTGVRIQFKHTPVLGRLPNQIETASFRIVQEALTNIARHAGVKEATVRVWSDGARLGLQIEDQGAGFHVEQVMEGRLSNGVAGMRERALVLGGDLTIDSAPGTGTRVTVEFPMDLGPVYTVSSPDIT